MKKYRVVFSCSKAIDFYVMAETEVKAKKIAYEQYYNKEYECYDNVEWADTELLDEANEDKEDIYEIT